MGDGANLCGPIERSDEESLTGRTVEIGMRQNTRTVVLRRGDETEAQRMQLPVNPRDIVIVQPQNTMSYVTVQGETIHAATGRGLAQVSLETFLPAEGSRFYRGVEPEEGWTMLRQWQKAGAPVRLTVSGTEVDDLFLITGLRQTLREGDGDLWIGVDLKEYRVVSLTEEDPAETESGGLYRRADERKLPSVYITEEGEDLWTIAKRFFGDGSRWRELAVKNGISDPHGLPGGKELLL